MVALVSLSISLSFIEIKLSFSNRSIMRLLYVVDIDAHCNNSHIKDFPKERYNTHAKSSINISRCMDRECYTFVSQNLCLHINKILLIDLK